MESFHNWIFVYGKWLVCSHFRIFCVISGNIRRFRRICEHIQSQVCSKRFSGPGSPPRVTNAVSESSSCGSDSSERLSCYKRQVIKVSRFQIHLFACINCSFEIKCMKHPSPNSYSLFCKIAADWKWLWKWYSIRVQ